MQSKKRKLIKISLLFLSIVYSIFAIASDPVKEEKSEVWNVYDFTNTSSFFTEVKFTKINFQGVETLLDGYKPSVLNKNEAVKYVDIVSRRLLEESLGLTNIQKAKKIRKIIFDLENYNFQVFGCEKNKHKQRIVTLIASKNINKQIEKNSLVGVLGGGESYFRAQIEYRHDAIQDIRIILNQDF